ncbi:MAG: hypothetical protein JW712_13275 [Dehalococcoidales bacterium]|nr:hypothetical protein [Dehalococcoidales bacterium]
MKLLNSTIRKETGQALPLALLVLALGSILVGSFLVAITSRMMNVDVFQESEFREDIVEAATAYVIEAIETGNYTLDEIPDTLTLNGITANFSVVEDVTAESDFSNEMFNDTEGFTNWVEDKVTLTEDPPDSGEYYATVIKHSYLQFLVDLDDYSDLVLRIHARVIFGKADDQVILRISNNGTDWTDVKTWTIADNSADYVYYNVDLTPYGITDTFWVSFESLIEWGAADFLMDEIKIVSGYTVVVTIVEN